MNNEYYVIDDNYFRMVSIAKIQHIHTHDNMHYQWLIFILSSPFFFSFLFKNQKNDDLLASHFDSDSK